MLYDMQNGQKITTIINMAVQFYIIKQVAIPVYVITFGIGGNYGVVLERK